MLISCPECATTFSVPDGAIGAKGRTLKCAKCGHKWHYSPETGGSFGLSESSLPPPPEHPPVPDFGADVGGHDFDRGPSYGGDQAVAEYASADHDPNDFDGAPAAAARAAAAFDLSGDLDEADDGHGVGDMRTTRSHEPIPKMFSGPTTTRRKSGTAGLWLLVVLILLAGAGGAAYYMQDKVVALWPPAETIFTRLGVRTSKPGAALQLRQAGVPERVVVDNVDVLLVRGVIANPTAKPQPVPPMSLELLNKAKKVVQKKVELPPVATLAPGGSAGFKIELKHPDPDAESIQLTFIDPSKLPKAGQ